MLSQEDMSILLPDDSSDDALDGLDSSFSTLLSTLGTSLFLGWPTTVSLLKNEKPKWLVNDSYESVCAISFSVARKARL